MQTFTKAERLSSKIAIDKLFGTGKSIYSAPYKLFWLAVDESDASVKIVISVPKRIYKRAVDRNRLKRLIREAYRKNKTILINGLNTKQINLMVIYTAKTILDHKEIENSLIVSLQRIVKNINSKS